MQYYMPYINVTKDGHDTIQFNPHRDGGIAYREDVEKEIVSLNIEISCLRAALAPILAHVDNPDTAPPLRISVRQAREMKEKIDGRIS